VGRPRIPYEVARVALLTLAPLKDWLPLTSRLSRAIWAIGVFRERPVLKGRRVPRVILCGLTFYTNEVCALDTDLCT